MMGFAGDWEPWTREVVAVGLDVALKSAVLIASAAILHIVVRKKVLVASAIWNACLVGLLTLPVVAVACPRWRIDCLPAGRDAAIRTAEMPRSEVFLRSAARIYEGALEEPIAAREAPRIAIASPREATPGGSIRVITGIGATLYLIVLGGLLARLARSLLAVRTLRRSSRPVMDRDWREARDRWRERLGLACSIDLARSEKLGVPVVVGWWRPSIILPERLGNLGPKAIDAILLHEMAHVRRGDYGWNIVLRLVQAIYWPQPLAWPIGRLVASVRERACDDLCVHWMGGTGDYRATLLGVADGLIQYRMGPGLLGMAMSRSTNLGRRLARLETSAGETRCLLGWPARLAIASMVLAAAGMLGSIRLARTADAAIQKPDEIHKPKADPKSEVQQAEKPEDTVKAPKNLPSVTLVKVKRGPLTRSTTQPGSLIAARSTDLYARVAGYLASLEFDIGTHVMQGQTLATIDAPELKAELTRQDALTRHAEIKVRRARAGVNAARAAIEVEKARLAEAKNGVESAESTLHYRKSERDRVLRLVQQHSLEQKLADEQLARYDAAAAALAAARPKVQSVEAMLKQRQAELEDAEAALEEAELDRVAASADSDRAGKMAKHTRIIAPFDGIVTQRNFHPGDLVRPPDGPNARPIFTITQEGRMLVVVRVPSNDVPFLDLGDPATMRLDAYPGRTFRGKVARMDYAIDPKDRTLHTEIDLPETDIKLRPGQFGQVTIDLETLPDKLSIPIGAYGNDNEGTYIYRLEGDRAVRQGIKVVENIGGRVVIEEGLKEGDQILYPASPVFGLRDGSKVKVVAPEELPKIFQGNFQ